MTFDLHDVTDLAVDRILDAAPGRQPHGLAAPLLCGGWHPKLPWTTCARDVAHLDDAGSLCLGIEARTGEVYSWFRTDEALRGPGSAGTDAAGGLTPAAPGSAPSVDAGGTR